MAVLKAIKESIMDIMYIFYMYKKINPLNRSKK